MYVTFVTFFLRPTTEYRSVESYLAHFATLVKTGVPILLFLDDTLSVPPAPNLKVVPIPHPVYPTDVDLPLHRNPAKDSVSYFWIQLEKLPFLARARELTTTPYLAWIDFGAFHMVRDPMLATLALRRLATRTYPTTAIFAPSCWSAARDSIWDRISWRFCGTFLLGHRDLFPAAAARQQELVQAHAPKLTWEVNYWCLMEDIFTAYPADHDERLFTELCHYVGPETSRAVKLVDGE